MNKNLAQNKVYSYFNIGDAKIEGKTEYSFL